ncbi:class I SAM-dependent methyltransferase [Hymenobacter sp. DH14]|uniref:Class I SAM-dependent methyltransferase n=1 Tax=Hymenobacter cyanobacteriorum TaxID=2926463 RepID=A0A9X2AG48_9BACT|nr:class I SAM-dependent methyltransferase [Hymenobacter cyanobacteriorum]MCI1185920.1 class I SAM-dependent methyltransferase [Hymenobacter cyanobacteriorum]
MSEQPQPNPADLVHLNELGYYEVTRKPTPEELRDYYAQRYYQENRSSYQPTYSEAEREHIEGKLRLRHWVLEQLLNPAGPTDNAASAAAQVPADAPVLTAPARTFLDVGCGEGWALDYFQRQGWDVLGLDFSSFSLEQFHPGLRGRLRAGDLYDGLQDLITEGRQFDVLWLDNVLEHVLDPAELLRRCRTLTRPGGVLMVDVPNDFSPLQQHLLATGHIDRPFWVALPDHLSYFGAEGLRNLAAATGWRTAKILGDQPIDLNLFNPATNYVMDKSAGKGAHQSRLEQDNFLLRKAPLPAVAAYYEAMAGVGLGRSVVAFLQPQAD